MPFSPFLPTPVETLELDHLHFYVKRDDLIDPYFSGNKFRKLHALLQIPSTHYTTLISYGGVQSNAMLSLARLCQIKGWSFRYYTKTLVENLRHFPEGNLLDALTFGMELEEISHADWQERIAELHGPQLDDTTLLVPQGGASELAREGMCRLAEEIVQWQEEQGIDRLTVVTPSGTGTTAYYLAQALPGCRVVTAPAVGDTAYLAAQMCSLGALPPNLQIIDTETRYRFATPHRELLAMHERLDATGVKFDMIYAPKMFKALLEHSELFDAPLLYVHSGGVRGNETMLERYRYKGWL